MTWEEVVAVGVKLPEVEVSTSYGTPALKVRGKLLTRPRYEDDSIVLLEIGFDEREMLMQVEPETFHITPHYQNYPSILARLSSVHPGTVAGLLERRWKAVAPKRLVKAWEVERG